ncbi:BnaC03g28050D [Brassica napus]|uniref:(rape) hypothetical protein n=1 Tax=Brassica napus TaxID=3708 RepID=A0A078H623_BRANA|nr:unnamed protein product [Brassica napus]CDY34010.1 BnaC03g28050D [Brassica napus]
MFFLFWFLSYSILIPIKYIKKKRENASPPLRFSSQVSGIKKNNERKKKSITSSSSVTLSLFFYRTFRLFSDPFLTTTSRFFPLPF